VLSWASVPKCRVSADVFGFALPGESLLRRMAGPTKVTKTLRPFIRPWLRQGSLLASLALRASLRLLLRFATFHSIAAPEARHNGPSVALGFGILRRSTSCIHAVVATSCRSTSCATTPFTLLGGLCTRLSLR
jgi:hypothetical protein